MAGPEFDTFEGTQSETGESREERRDPSTAWGALRLPHFAQERHGPSLQKRERRTANDGVGGRIWHGWHRSYLISFIGSMEP